MFIYYILIIGNKVHVVVYVDVVVFVVLIEWQTSRTIRIALLIVSEAISIVTYSPKHSETYMVLSNNVYWY